MNAIFKYFFIGLVLAAWMAAPLNNLFFSHQQKNIRQQMKKRLETEIGLVKLQIPTDSIYWVRPGKEIVYQGRMFDIKTLEVAGNISFIAGLYDEEEQWLHKKLAQQLGKEQNAQNQKLIKLIHLFSAFADVKSFQSNRYEYQFSQHYYPYSPLLQKGFRQLITPPPLIVGVI